jgi:hypothetical protein
MIALFWRDTKKIIWSMNEPDDFRERSWEDCFLCFCGIQYIERCWSLFGCILMQKGHIRQVSITYLM